jgi:membrane-bound lytic murein transglycosylase D
MIHKKLHFEQITKVVNMPLAQIKELNPQYRAGIIPATKKRPLALKLPYNYLSDFVDKQDSVLAYNRAKYFDNKDRLVDPRSRRMQYAQAAPKNRTKVYYKVKKGDVVGTLAEKFKVRTADMRYWNNIRRNNIRIGQKLVFYVPNSKISKIAKDKNVTIVGASRLPVKNGKSQFLYHRVRRGENLWTIARKYPGVSNRDIMRWNNIKNAKLVKPGKKLKIMI